jgi:hypothetical protein
LYALYTGITARLERGNLSLETKVLAGARKHQAVDNHEPTEDTHNVEGLEKILTK